MTKNEEMEKWNKLEVEIIYEHKALSCGVFSNGRYYDFYQKKEAIGAEQFVKNKMTDSIERTSVIDVEIDKRKLYRLTIVFAKKN